MTIHGAKGLEAPVVFLLDTARGESGGKTHEALVEWPAGRPRPDHFLLRPDKAHRDRLSESVIDRAEAAGQREEANLLYVAATRARQVLYISGSLASRGNDRGWYQQIAGAFEVSIDDIEAPVTLEASNTPPASTASIEPRVQTEPTIDPRLRQPIRLLARQLEIAPSRQGGELHSEVVDEDGRQRGIVIHRCLEWLCAEPGLPGETVQQRLAGEAPPALLEQWFAEARDTFESAALTEIFHPAAGVQSYNELPLLYRHGDQTVNGVIDRLLIEPARIQIIDYKTHRAAVDDPAAVAAQYARQMQLYADGVRRLWPGREVQAALLFTASAQLWPMQV